MIFVPLMKGNNCEYICVINEKEQYLTILPLELSNQNSNTTSLALLSEFINTLLCSNAYFYGMCNNKRIVLYDTLLQQVSPDEIVAILGHELGHWRMWHTVVNFGIIQLYLFIVFMAFGKFMGNEGLYASFGFDPSGKPVIIGLVLFFQVFWREIKCAEFMSEFGFQCIWSPFEHMIKFGMNVLSRKNEFEADTYAKELGCGHELQSGLVKLHLENLGNMNPDPLYSAYHYR